MREEGDRQGGEKWRDGMKKLKVCEKGKLWGFSGERGKKRMVWKDSDGKDVGEENKSWQEGQ